MRRSLFAHGSIATEKRERVLSLFLDDCFSFCLRRSTERERSFSSSMLCNMRRRPHFIVVTMSHGCQPRYKFVSHLTLCSMQAGDSEDIHSESNGCVRTTRILAQLSWSTHSLSYLPIDRVLNPCSSICCVSIEWYDYAKRSDFNGRGSNIKRIVFCSTP